jgi:hypothetical protein
MKKPLRRPLLSLLPLPLIAGWYLASTPQEQPLAAPETPVLRAAAGSESLYPPPQVGDDEPPAAQPPTF